MRHLGSVPKDRRARQGISRCFETLFLKGGCSPVALSLFAENAGRGNSELWQSKIGLARSTASRKRKLVNTKMRRKMSTRQVSIRMSDKKKTGSDGRCLAVSLLRNHSRWATLPEVKDARYTKAISHTRGCASHSRTVSPTAKSE